MASPQIENGFTTIANELLNALCRIRVSGEAMQVLMAILRKTYGFKRKEDHIALSQLVEITGLKKSAVCKAINKLVEMNLIGKKTNGKKGNILAINKDSDSWKPVPKRSTPAQYPIKDTPVSNKEYQRVSNKGNEGYPILDNTKERVKEKIKEISTNVDRRSANPHVDELLKSLKDKLGTDTLDGSEKMNRRYAWLLLGKCHYRENSEQACLSAKKVIDLAFRDSFHAGNATSFRYLFNNAVKIVASAREKSAKNNIIGL